MEKRILNIAIKHWNDRFSGISALDVADKLKITNAEVMTLMEGLHQKGKGSLNANVTLYQVKINLNNKTKTAKVAKPEPVETHIFFPSKSVLTRHYERNLLKYSKNGEYKNKLRTGNSQIALIYFKINVLSKYLDNKEYYSLNDNVTGGVARIQNDIITNMTQDEYDEIGFDKIWYGKRKLKNGETAISALLIDLSKLPLKEQSYWHGFEIDKPEFTQHDPDFGKFVARAFDGKWVDSNDPVENIYKEIGIINKLVPKPIFNQVSNPYLKYPTNNSFKDFADANSELYKIIGPDNLNSKNIKMLFVKYFKDSIQDLIHKESKRELSSYQILQLILIKLDNHTADSFNEHWKEIKAYRIEGDHKITNPKKDDENYIDKFRFICERTVDILKQISESLRIKRGA